MWFATRDGLSRFDGSWFVNYQVGDKRTSPGVENIYEIRVRNAITIRVGSFAVISGKQIETVGNLSADSMKKKPLE